MFVELDIRQGAGYAVSLEWDRDTGETQIVVADTRFASQPASGLVALTVGCLALSAYMVRDLTGGAAIALSVDAVICLVGLNSASADGRPHS